MAESTLAQFDANLLLAHLAADIVIDGCSTPIEHNSAHQTVQIVTVAKVSRPTLISIADYSAVEPSGRFVVLRLVRDRLAGIVPGASLQSLYCIWLN